MPNKTKQIEERTTDPDGQPPADTPEKQSGRGPKAQAKADEPLLCGFFGPECQGEIAEDGSITRGAETFAAVAHGGERPPGNWHEFAENDSAVLLLKK